MVRSSGESLSEDITLKAREFAQRSNILRGRQIIWMMIDYFKTNRSLQEQYTWQDIEALQWQGDEKHQWFLHTLEVDHDQLIHRYPRASSPRYIPVEDSTLEETPTGYCRV